MDGIDGERRLSVHRPGREGLVPAERIDLRDRTRLRGRARAPLDRELPQSASPYFESEEQLARAFEAAARREELVRWLRRQMGRRLTARERAYISAYYLEALTMEEVAARFKVGKSSVSRGIRRALKQLRICAQGGRQDARRAGAVRWTRKYYGPHPGLRRPCGKKWRGCK